MNAAGSRMGRTREKYVAHARRLRGTPGNRGARTASTGRDETQRIRDWAKAHGYNPSARGRISQDIKKAYDAAQA
ncbi:Lsr2 family DNA-binding protein [Pseudarthrobacter sp. S9]|uniref:Lsr2 family DNA-binding protein n=1 Tax=Pseudarthrobacter sp. S9 TaxID=3418421 RepID=UPI003D08195A